MGNIRYLFLLIFAVMLSVSCSNDDDNGDEINDSALIGTWGVTEIDEDFEVEFLITFNPNNSGVSVYSFTYDEETETETEYFTWSTNGNRLIIIIDGETNNLTYSITGNKLTITDGDGDSTVFTKQ